MLYNPWPDTAVTSQQGPYQYGNISHIGGVAIGDLIAAYGSPFYLMDIETVTSRIRQWIDAMGDPAAIHYASKALPIVGMMSLMHKHGLGIDVATGGELATALVAGVPGSSIVFHGNNKSTKELQYAIDSGVHRIVIDSLDEANRLIALASPDNPVHVLLRLTPGVLAKTHASIETASEQQKFGLSIRYGLAEQALHTVQNANNLVLTGFHVHLGSNIKDPDSFSAGIKRIVDFAIASNVELAELNVGGGLGVPFSETDHAPSIAQHVQTINEAVQDHVDPNTVVMVEPGRSLVGTAGVTVYTVGTVKTVGGVRFVSVNGGLSDNPRPALYEAEHPFAIGVTDTTSNEVLHYGLLDSSVEGSQSTKRTGATADEVARTVGAGSDPVEPIVATSVEGGQSTKRTGATADEVARSVGVGSDLVEPIVATSVEDSQSTKRTGPMEPAIIAGLHCESGDLLAHHVTLPADLQPGDVLIAGVTGAYTYSMASHYNRVPNPPVVGVLDGNHGLLVRGETWDDMYKNDIATNALPSWL